FLCFRREALRDSLMEKLELEKRALQIVERLLDDNVTEDFLVDCAKFITTSNYKDAIEERSIAKMCGYPICPNKLGKVTAQKYKISTKTNKVYDITERKSFCSNLCYKASKEFEVQISQTPLWLRCRESGAHGEELKLVVPRIRKEDIENPPAVDSGPLEAPGGPLRSLRADPDSSDDEEQGFVSSVVSQRSGPRVHWGDLPKRTDEGAAREDGGRKERRTEQEKEGTKLSGESKEQNKSERTEINENNKERDPGPMGAIQGDLTFAQEERSAPSVSATVAQGNPTPARQSQPGAGITEVGMSKRGAAGLRGLLKSHGASGPPPAHASVRANVLEHLRRTLWEWRTEGTLVFLYGPDYCARRQKEEREVEEEEDEDDLGEVVEAAGGGRAGGRPRDQARPSAAAPDYSTLSRQTKEMELRVNEFYKGTFVLPEEKLNPPAGGSQSGKDPALPLIDSQAQHLIQKRITVEKLSRCLRNIVGSLSLTMTDVSTDLNKLVRTFRFTNTNIIHKTPHWTIIAVVLLHVLSEVSPAVRESMESPATVEFVNTLLLELTLRYQDLLDLVQIMKPPAL
ncbi:putative RNA polymerase II subunit B1 CTD phosphatase rpap2, partial [Aplochiton taeniatus]